MKIVIVDTYYPAFLAEFYSNKFDVLGSNYSVQLDSLLASCFGTSDFYSRHLNELGCDASDLIVNCVPLQKAWAHENSMKISGMFLKISPRFYRVPFFGQIFANIPGLIDIAITQIKKSKPDVLYCQDLSFFPGDVLKELKEHVSLIVGQIASPLPQKSFLRGYDLILSSLPQFVQQFRNIGISSEYFRIGFDERVLSLLDSLNKDISFSFVGGISRNHSSAIPLLEYLAKNTDISIFGYGVNSLPKSSPLRNYHQGEVWGLEMYEALARSQITLNRHINIAGESANNMRLYEATGVGSLLLTDYKENLNELFDVNREVLTYRNKEEALEKVLFYLEHPLKAKEIAEAGQRRTLSEHRYSSRMEELVSILRKYL